MHQLTSSFLYTACGYAYIGLSDEEYRFRQVLNAFLFTMVTLNVLVTVLLGTRVSRLHSFSLV